jgi:hypothetical protein
MLGQGYQITNPVYREKQNKLHEKHMLASFDEAAHIFEVTLIRKVALLVRDDAVQCCAL